jgi:hypothetical protein
MRGHIHKRVRTNAAGKETVRWYVVVDTGFDENERRKQKWHGGFDTRRAAEVERAKIVSNLHSGGYVAPDRLTLGEWVRHSWLPMTKTRVKPSTFDSYRANMETHVLPVLGSRALQQLTAPMLNTLYADLLNHGGERGPLAPKTVRSSTRSSTRRSGMRSMPGSSERTLPSGQSRRGRIGAGRRRSSAGSRLSSLHSSSRSRARASRQPGGLRR